MYMLYLLCDFTLRKEGLQSKVRLTAAADSGMGVGLVGHEEAVFHPGEAESRVWGGAQAAAVQLRSLQSLVLLRWLEEIGRAHV